MKPRMNFYQAAPDTMKALMALETQIAASGLEQSLIELVRTRASQINGCAFCINMHTQDARKRGETEQRLYLLNAWREAPSIPTASARRWPGPKSVTLISQTHAPDDVYEEVRAHFSEAETVNLTALIGSINAWNRLAIAFRAMPPARRPPRRRPDQVRSLIKYLSPSRSRHRFREGAWPSAPACRSPPVLPSMLTTGCTNSEALVMKASLAFSASSTENARSSTRSWRSSASFTTALRVQPGRISLPF